MRQEEINHALVTQDRHGESHQRFFWRELGENHDRAREPSRASTRIWKRPTGKSRNCKTAIAKINLSDRTKWSNQTLNFARELGQYAILARVITARCSQRNESRGAHYKPEFPDRDDANWLKTTRAKWKNARSS